MDVTSISSTDLEHLEAVHAKKEKESQHWVSLCLGLVVCVLLAFIASMTSPLMGLYIDRASSKESDMFTALEFCKQAVSKGQREQNSFCWDICEDQVKQGGDPGENETFATWCEFPLWQVKSEINGRLEGCFDHWIHGTHILDNPKICGLTSILSAKNPSSCQLMCQMHSRCVRWIYLPSWFGRCCLLDSATVSEAIDSVVSAKRFESSLNLLNAESLDPFRADDPNDKGSGELEVQKITGKSACSDSITQKCLSDQTQCLVCGTSRRCIWTSPHAIAGWKFCTYQDLCNSPWHFPFKPIEFDVYDCENVISTSANRLNAECATACRDLQAHGENPSTSLSFTQNCHATRWKWSYTTETVTLEDESFDLWMYGHESNFDLPSLIARSPADCQSACQTAIDCVRFSWYANPTKTDYQTCILKSAESVSAALNTRFTNAPTTDDDACPRRLPYYCIFGFRKCLRCNAEIEAEMCCVWYAPSYISGWKFSTKNQPLCQMQSTPSLIAI